MALKKDVDNILACFSGEDGGIKFAAFKFGMETLEEQYANGDTAAGEVLQIVTRFSELLDALDKVAKGVL